MKKDIPEIGDLTQGINDSDIILTHKLPEMLENHPASRIGRMVQVRRKRKLTENLSIFLPQRRWKIIGQDF